jgi:hypothetical protein
MSTLISEMIIIEICGSKTVIQDALYIVPNRFPGFINFFQKMEQQLQALIC